MLWLLIKQYTIFLSELEVINNGNENQPTYIDYPCGRGRVWANMHTIEWGYDLNKPQFLLNELQCANEWKGLFPGQLELEALEAKIDDIGVLLIQLDELKRLINGLVLAVETLEAKSDAMEAKLDVIQSKVTSGEVVTQNDLAAGQGGVYFMGAEKQPKP